MLVVVTMDEVLEDLRHILLPSQFSTITNFVPSNLNEKYIPISSAKFNCN